MFKKQTASMVLGTYAARMLHEMGRPVVEAIGNVRQYEREIQLPDISVYIPSFTIGAVRDGAIVLERSLCGGGRMSPQWAEAIDRAKASGYEDIARTTRAVAMLWKSALMVIGSGQDYAEIRSVLLAIDGQLHLGVNRLNRLITEYFQDRPYTRVSINRVKSIIGGEGERAAAKLMVDLIHYFAESDDPCLSMARALMEAERQAIVESGDYSLAYPGEAPARMIAAIYETCTDGWSENTRASSWEGVMADAETYIRHLQPEPRQVMRFAKVVVDQDVMTSESPF